MLVPRFLKLFASERLLMLVPRFLKLFASEHLRLEDALTADVFGSLDLLPRRPFLTGFLDRVSKQNPASVLAGERLDLAQRDAEEFRFDFWPGLCAPAGLAHDAEDGRDLTTTVPDVVLESSSWVIGIESKFHAPLGVPSHQLARQFACLHSIAKGREFALLAVTTGLTPPEMQRHGGARTDALNPVEGSVLEYLERLEAGSRMRQVRRLARQLLRLVPSRVMWTNWHTIRACVSDALAACNPGPVKETDSFVSAGRRFGERVLSSMELRGFFTFHGFNSISGDPVLAGFRRGPLLELGKKETE